MTHTVSVPASFRLSAAASFYGGFVPMGGAATVVGDRLGLAFLLDRTWEPVGVRLWQEGDRMTAEIRGTADGDAVIRQVRRMLGLDADAEAWRALGRRDPRVGALQQAFDGFFTAAFPSPYEAGVGGILAQRTSIPAARKVRTKLSEAHGTAVDGLWVLPSPERLLEVTESPGLPAHKIPWLHGLARAALDGALDADRLRAMPEDQALAELQRLPGIGPWTAAHVLFRGAAAQDAVPGAEPRVIRAIAELYGPDADVGQITDSWRPFRMWVSVLAVRHLGRVGKFTTVPGERRRRA